MPGYPLFLKLEGRRCLVFGGGEVGTRKVKSLLSRGAKVTCMSVEFSNDLRRMARKMKKQLTLQQWNRKSKISLGSAGRLPSLVIAATSDREFNRKVAKACNRKRIWVNAVDDPTACDFYVPAVVERGPLQIAISTDGASPLLAKKLRETFEKAIPESTGKLVARLGRIREEINDARRGNS